MKNQTPNQRNQTAAPSHGAQAAPSGPAPAPAPDLPSAYSADEGFISKRELARRLNKSLRTIDYWRRRGIIPYIKCGHSALFKWTDIDAHLQKHFRVCRQQAPTQPSPKQPTERNPHA
jgi:hypothetical protein